MPPKGKREPVPKKTLADVESEYAARQAKWEVERDALQSKLMHHNHMIHDSTLRNEVLEVLRNREHVRLWVEEEKTSQHRVSEAAERGEARECRKKTGESIHEAEVEIEGLVSLLRGKIASANSAQERVNRLEEVQRGTGATATPAATSHTQQSSSVDQSNTDISAISINGVSFQQQDTNTSGGSNGATVGGKLNSSSSHHVDPRFPLVTRTHTAAPHDGIDDRILALASQVQSHALAGSQTSSSRACAQVTQKAPPLRGQIRVFSSIPQKTTLGSTLHYGNNTSIGKLVDLCSGCVPKLDVDVLDLESVAAAATQRSAIDVAPDATHPTMASLLLHSLWQPILQFSETSNVRLRQTFGTFVTGEGRKDAKTGNLLLHFPAGENYPASNIPISQLMDVGFRNPFASSFLIVDCPPTVASTSAADLAAPFACIIAPSLPEPVLLRYNVSSSDATPAVRDCALLEMFSTCWTNDPQAEEGSMRTVETLLKDVQSRALKTRGAGIGGKPVFVLPEQSMTTLRESARFGSRHRLSVNSGSVSFAPQLVEFPLAPPLDLSGMGSITLTSLPPEPPVFPPKPSGDDEEGEEDEDESDAGYAGTETSSVAAERKAAADVTTTTSLQSIPFSLAMEQILDDTEGTSLSDVHLLHDVVGRRLTEGLRRQSLLLKLPQETDTVIRTQPAGGEEICFNLKLLQRGGAEGDINQNSSELESSEDEDDEDQDGEEAGKPTPFLLRLKTRFEDVLRRSDLEIQVSDLVHRATVEHHPGTGECWARLFLGVKGYNTEYRLQVQKELEWVLQEEFSKTLSMLSPPSFRFVLSTQVAFKKNSMNSSALGRDEAETRRQMNEVQQLVEQMRSLVWLQLGQIAHATARPRILVTDIHCHLHHTDTRYSSTGELMTVAAGGGGTVLRSIRDGVGVWAQQAGNRNTKKRPTTVDRDHSPLYLQHMHRASFERQVKSQKWNGCVVLCFPYQVHTNISSTFHSSSLPAGASSSSGALSTTQDHGLLAKLLHSGGGLAKLRQVFSHRSIEVFGFDTSRLHTGMMTTAHEEEQQSAAHNAALGARLSGIFGFPGSALHHLSLQSELSPLSIVSISYSGGAPSFMGSTRIREKELLRLLKESADGLIHQDLTLMSRDDAEKKQKLEEVEELEAERKALAEQVEQCHQRRKTPAAEEEEEVTMANVNPALMISSEPVPERPTTAEGSSQNALFTALGSLAVSFTGTASKTAAEEKEEDTLLPIDPLKIQRKRYTVQVSKAWVEESLIQQVATQCQCKTRTFPKDDDELEGAASSVSSSVRSPKKLNKSQLAGNKTPKKGSRGGSKSKKSRAANSLEATQLVDARADLVGLSFGLCIEATALADFDSEVGWLKQRKVVRSETIRYTVPEVPTEHGADFLGEMTTAAAQFVLDLEECVEEGNQQYNGRLGLVLRALIETPMVPEPVVVAKVKKLPGKKKSASSLSSSKRGAGAKSPSKSPTKGMAGRSGIGGESPAPEKRMQVMSRCWGEERTPSTFFACMEHKKSLFQMSQAVLESFSPFADFYLAETPDGTRMKHYQASCAPISVSYVVKEVPSLETDSQSSTTARTSTTNPAVPLLHLRQVNSHQVERLMETPGSALRDFQRQIPLSEVWMLGGLPPTPKVTDVDIHRPFFDLDYVPEPDYPQLLASPEEEAQLKVLLKHRGSVRMRVSGCTGLNAGLRAPKGVWAGGVKSDPYVQVVDHRPRAGGRVLMTTRPKEDTLSPTWAPGDASATVVVNNLKCEPLESDLVQVEEEGGDDVAPTVGDCGGLVVLLDFNPSMDPTVEGPEIHLVVRSAKGLAKPQLANASVPATKAASTRINPYVTVTDYGKPKHRGGTTPGAKKNKYLQTKEIDDSGPNPKWPEASSRATFRLPPITTSPRSQGSTTPRASRTDSGGLGQSTRSIHEKPPEDGWDKYMPYGYGGGGGGTANSGTGLKFKVWSLNPLKQFSDAYTDECIGEIVLDLTAMEKAHSAGKREFELPLYKPKTAQEEEEEKKQQQEQEAALLAKELAEDALSESHDSEEPKEKDEEEKQGYFEFTVWNRHRTVAAPRTRVYMLDELQALGLNNKGGDASLGYSGLRGDGAHGLFGCVEKIVQQMY